ncbi:hypothetical protein IMZ48_14645 [Candidatus Bathyarchaeota archaeon]|nr:hypothetical protein [Candidatus Bathyarchaeota archaeon]
MENCNDPDRKEHRFPVIIDEASIFKSPDDLKELLRLPEVPELAKISNMKFPTTLSKMKSPPDDDAEKVNICDVDVGQFDEMRRRTDGENVLVWFGGGARDAWHALSVRADEPPGSPPSRWAPGAWEAARKYWRNPDREPRFPIIIDEASLIKSPKYLQEVLDLPEAPAPRETNKMMPPPDDYQQSGEKVVICDIDMGQSATLRDVTDGEDILVWFGDKRRNAWYARSLKTE